MLGIKVLPHWLLCRENIIEFNALDMVEAGYLGYGTHSYKMNNIIQDEMVVSVWHLLHEAENVVIMLTLGVDGQIL